MIELQNVTKYYTTPHGRHYVLRDVSVHIPKQTKVAVLGMNGAGKSTLLRLIAGVDVPNGGTITRNGKISWPMGLASCLQRTMTGLENARFACRIQGASRSETKRALNYVKNFSELGDYFDMPVKSYSSGMRARLQFAIAMAFDFDCYLIDELTAVGDQSFRNRSEQAFRDKRHKASFIKVSHNLGELLKDCDAALILHNAKLRYYPSMTEAVDIYRSMLEDKQKQRQQKRKAALQAKAGNAEASSQAPQGKMTQEDKDARWLAKAQENRMKRIAARRKAAAAKGSGAQHGLTNSAAVQRRRNKKLQPQETRPPAALPKNSKGAKPRPLTSRGHAPAPMAPRLVRR